MKRFTKKIAFVMALVMVFALTSAVSANAAEAYAKKWSFTGATGEWLDGTQPYDATVGYGLKTGSLTKKGTQFKSESTKDAGVMVGLDCDADFQSALASSAYSGAETIFVVDLPAGTYDVVIYAGAASNNSTYNANLIYLNGVVFDQAPANSDNKTSGSVLLTIDDISYKRTITLDAASQVEIKATNEMGRAFLSGLAITEAVAETPAVPKDGESMTVAYIAALAVISAGAAVLVSKKRKEA